MHPQLQHIAQDLQSATRRVHALVLSTPDDHWSRRANPDAWSVGECVAHLNLTSEVFIPRLRAALSDERFRGVPAPARYRRDLAGWLVGLVAGPLPRIGGRRIGRLKTGASFVPAGDAPRATTVAQFDRLQEEMHAILRDAEGRPLERMKVKSPFDPSGRLRYNVYAALIAIPRHQHRHLDQADEVWTGAA